jgi:hypothetical protein
MPKIITERPRHRDFEGSGFVQFDKPRFDDSDMMFAPLRHRRFRSKNFTDLISPLQRYLHKQIGRPWNDVWSEICQTIPNGGVSLSHARDHIFDFVDLHNNGIQGGYQMYYVNPDGILVAHSAKPRSRPQKGQSQGIVKNVNTQYHFRNGWFELELNQLSSMLLRTRAEAVHFGQYDCWLKLSAVYTNTNLFWRTYGDYKFCVAKRQLNKKEIKKLELPHRR